MLIKPIFLTVSLLLLTGFSAPVENKSVLNLNNLIAQSSQEKLDRDGAEIKQIVTQHITQLFQLTPEYQVEVLDIAVNGDYAMAEWLVEHVAGLLFLKRTSSGWQLMPIPSGGVPGVEELVSSGIPRTIAQSFIDYLNNPNK